MGLPTRITLPPSGRPVGGLTSAARPIGGDWWRGVTFASAQCTAPQAVGTCTDGDVAKTPNDLSDTATFDAFAVLQALRCSTMGGTRLVEFAGQSLDATREFAIARELLTGAASGNPSLADAVVIGSAGVTDPTTALACLDAHAAETLSGRLAFIHVSPQLATLLLAASAITPTAQGNYATALGNVVVVSSGYDGRGPAGFDDDLQYLYATGVVHVEFGMRENLEAVERGQNDSIAIVEEAAIAIFDPCFNVAVSTDVDTCVLEPVS